VGRGKPKQERDDDHLAAHQNASRKDYCLARPDRRTRQDDAPSQIILKIPHMLLAQGAIVIKAGEEPIAALGVSGAPGGDKDEACACAALDKISDRLK